MIRFPEELKKQIRAYTTTHTDVETVAKFGVSKSTVTRYKKGVSRAGKTPHKKTPTTRKHAHPRKTKQRSAGGASKQRNDVDITGLKSLLVLRAGLLEQQAENLRAAAALLE